MKPGDRALAEIQELDASPVALLRESAVYGLGVVLSRGLAVVLTPILARVFSPDEFGMLDFLQIATGFCSMFMSLRMESALLRYYPERADRGILLFTYLTTQVVLGAAFLAVAWLVGVPLASRFLPIDAGITVMAAALTVPASILYAHALTLVRARREASAASSWICLNTLANILGVAWFVLGLRVGLPGVFFAKAVADGGCAIVIIGRYRLHYTPTYSWDVLGRFLRFGLPLVPDELLTLVRAHAAKVFLVTFTSLADVGLFAVANRLALMVNLCLSSFRQAWVPFAMSIARRRDADRTYRTVFRFYAAGTSVLLFGFVMFSREIVLVLGGPSYEGARWLLGLVGAIGIVGNLPYIFNIGLMLEEKMVYYLVGVAVSTVVSVVAAWYLISRFGLIGAPASGLLASVVFSGIVLYFAQRVRHIPYGVGLLLGFLGVLTCVAALGATDFFLEIPLSVRAIIFLVPTGGLAAIAARTLFGPQSHA